MKKIITKVLILLSTIIIYSVILQGGQINNTRYEFSSNLIESSPFYEGHSPEVALTDQDTYVAAYQDSLPNHFVLKFNKVIEVNDILLEWYSINDYPKDFQVFLETEGNEWKCIIDEKDYKIDYNSAYYIKKLNQPLKATGIKMVVRATNGQERLLLNKIYFNKGWLSIEDVNSSILSKFGDKLTKHQMIMLFMEWIYDNIAYELGTADPTITINTKIGACGDKSNLLIAMCQEMGIQGRLVNLYNYPKPGLGHTVAEVYYDGKWRIYDPTYGVYYTSKLSDVGNYLNPEVATIDELKKNPSIADNNKVVIGLKKYFNDQDRIDLYLGSKVYKYANPIGTIGPDKPMDFPAKFDLKNGYAAYGKEDNSNTEMKDIYTIPAAMFMLGSAYQNVNHEYILSNLVKGQNYILEIGVTDRADMEVDIETKNVSLLTKSKINMNKEKIQIKFTANEEEGKILIKHNYLDAKTYILLDYIKVRKIDN